MLLIAFANFLLGIILGMRFKVTILFLFAGIPFLELATSGVSEMAWSSTLLRFGLLITALEFGYFSGSWWATSRSPIDSSRKAGPGDHRFVMISRKDGQ
jgi:hypothetical protein